MAASAQLNVLISGGFSFKTGFRKILLLLAFAS
jgi:hypothetical protein